MNFLYVAKLCFNIFIYLQQFVANNDTLFYMEQQLYYIEKLKESLSEKQRSNPSYSLRAFARFLDIHGSTLSQVLNSKRGLPLKRAKDVVDKLDLSPKERTLFMESFFRSKTDIDEIGIDKLDKRFILDESYFKVIAEWEHYAALELFKLEGFNFSLVNVSHKLEIEPIRAEVVINNLINCNLIMKENGEYKKVYSDVKTTEDITSSALRKSHKETLHMGLNKLEEIEVELRDFSSTTVAVDLEKIPEAKTIIREFRQKMTALLRDGKKTDVYQLAIQFYPLTKTKQEFIQ